MSPSQPPAPCRWVKLGEVCEVRAGADYKAVAAKDGQYPIYGTGGEMGRAIKARCPANSVIVGRKGTLDNPMLIREPFWNIDTCFGVIPSTDVLPDYLYRFCQNFDFYALVPAMGRPSTTSEAIRGIDLPLPPLPVQREIVARLERELGAVEKVAKKFEELERAAEAEFKATLKECFEGLGNGQGNGTNGTYGTNGTKLARAAQVGDGADGAAVASVARPMSPSCPMSPIQPPAPCRWVKLGEVCEFHRGLTYSKKDEVANSTNVVLRSNNVDLSTGKLDLTELKYISEEFFIPQEKRVGLGSLLMCMANGSKAHLGKIAIIDREIDFAFGGFMGLLVPNNNRVLSEYLYWVLSAYEFKQLIAGLTDGTNINNLKFSDIECFFLPLPPLPTQHAIVARLDAARERRDGLVAAAKKGREAAALWRKAILKEAFE